MASFKSIQRLQAAFADEMHLDLPAEFASDGLLPVDSCGLLMSTHPTVARNLLIGRDRTALMDAVPIGHHTVGFWGYGVNSNAWYFIRRTPQERLYLRLQTGGAYTDMARAKADITDFVPPFVHLLRETRRRGGRLYAFESIGVGLYAAQVDGKARKFELAACGRADVMRFFERLLSIVPAVASPSEAQAIDAIRASALATAKAIYAEQVQLVGNERVGMRAMGAAMAVIRALEVPPTAREFRQTLRLQLAALEERHVDYEGQHAIARACLRQMLTILSGGST